IEHSRTEEFIASLRKAGLDDRIEQLKASSQGVFIEK
ncbi:MAG: homoserine kinase, partial [Lactobacillus gasseri]|nr:homoserine kinase [Lactobacillus gasseri]